MLENDLIEARSSEWSSLWVLAQNLMECIGLIQILGKSVRWPSLIHILYLGVDNCVDRVENAKFLSKLDLLKGYWQVPLTTRANSWWHISTKKYCLPERKIHQQHYNALLI